ncbi:MAG: N-acyl homoserine lactonase family protein [Crocinitomicaceae bacterium]|nr:N-acyl homoserine lactonase family protein [Crocinitomicaceae bacterium]
MFKNVSATFSIQGEPIQVHAVSTGAVAVKTKFRESRKKGWRAQLDFLLDKRFTEWMPIWVWIIEHPEGIFIIDTGENTRVNSPGYFKSSGMFSNWINTTQFRFQVSRADEIDQQLIRLGIDKSIVHAVVLTHLHLDHVDGLYHFPETRIVVHRREWEKPYGNLPKLYPYWLQPDLITLDTPYKTFSQAQFLTKAKDLIAVHTPGHTYGHMSVLLKTDTCHILFAGDICYYEEQVTHQRFSGINVTYKGAENSYANIRALAQQEPLIFLPSHDANAGERLASHAFLNFDRG